MRPPKEIIRRTCITLGPRNKGRPRRTWWDEMEESKMQEYKFILMHINNNKYKVSSATLKRKILSFRIKF